MLNGLRSRHPIPRLSLGVIGLLVVAGAVAGCRANDTSDSAGTEASRPSTSQPAPAAQTFAELAARPCTALDAKDTERFQVTVTGYEIPGVPSGCFWMTKEFGIGFHPHPSDRTSLVPPTAGATQITVDGRRAVQIPEARSDGKNGGCQTEVAADSGASFSVEITVQAGIYGGTTLDTCAIGTDVATAILAHLH